MHDSNCANRRLTTAIQSGKVIVLKKCSDGEKAIPSPLQRAAGWCKAVRQVLRHWPRSSRVDGLMAAGAAGT